MISRDREEETVQRLTDLLDGIEERVEHGRRTAALDERNRINLLFGHALFAAMVGPGFALLAKTGMASASFVIVRRVPGAPYSLAAWIFVAGLALATATYHRRRLGEYLALGALLLWYVTFSVSLIAAIGIWMAPAVRAGGLGQFTEHLDWGHAPAIYAPVVYAHLAYAMGGHMRTIRKLGLRHRGGGRDG